MDPSALPAPRATAPADCRDIAVGFITPRLLSRRAPLNTLPLRGLYIDTNAYTNNVKRSIRPKGHN